MHLAGRTSIRGLARAIAVAAGASGLALAAFSHLRFLPLALVLMAVVGGGVIFAAASTNTILQSIVDDRLRGRVAGFYTMAFLGVSPLGNLAAGALAASIGAPATFLLNGALAVIAALWFRRELKSFGPLLRSTYRRLGIVPD
jgi:MFS family permease